MANTITEIQLPTGLVGLTLSVYEDGSDTLANAAPDDLTEATNRLGLYTATVAEALTGLHYVKVLQGTAVIATGWVYLQDTTSTYHVEDSKALAGGVPVADGAITSASFTVETITGVASGFLEQVVQLWRYFFKRTVKDETTIKTYADDGTTVVTSQPYVDTESSQERGVAV